MSGFNIPNFDPLQEDYHIDFEASGNSLIASISRERVANGVLVETFLGSISGVDNSLNAGQVGILSFARDANRVFFDDITVSEVPEPQTPVLFALSLALYGVTVFGRRLRRAHRG